MEEMLGPASIPFSSDCDCILEKTVETTLWQIWEGIRKMHLHKKQ